MKVKMGSNVKHDVTKVYYKKRNKMDQSLSISTND